MKELREGEIEQILQGNTENLNLEFKDTFDFDDSLWMREELIKSIIAMSNTRNGGCIVVGIHENGDKTINLSGMEESHLSKFILKEEVLKEKVEGFSSAPADYDIGWSKYKGQKFLIITVREFTLNPLICRRDGEYKKECLKENKIYIKRVLKEGAIYIRTLKSKPSSVKLTNPTDIEDLLDRSVYKKISKLHKQGWQHEAEAINKSAQNFKKERADF